MRRSRISRRASKMASSEKRLGKPEDVYRQISNDMSHSVADCGRLTGKQEVIPNNPSGNRLLAPVVKKDSSAAAASG
jgi:hypothetical protein